jgi:hypothetical protein
MMTHSTHNVWRPSVFVRRIFFSFIAVFSIFVIIIIFFISFRGTESNLSNDISTSANISVFYDSYPPVMCNQVLHDLENDNYFLDKHMNTVLDFPPKWDHINGLTQYAMFNLYTLRFLECYIHKAELGDKSALLRALEVIFDWYATTGNEQGNNSWVWEEHATAWRSVLLSYFKTVAKKLSFQHAKIANELQEIASLHGKFLSKPSVYRSDHNHGISNALGLLALGVTFYELPDANSWIRLAFSRAEQQMYDNVSDDGVHLEQTGFYHFYTLRSFTEILRVALRIGFSLSDGYIQKLKKMIVAGAQMVGSNGEIEGLAYSNLRKGSIEAVLENVESLDLETLTPAIRIFKEVSNGRSKSGLHMFPEGGYAFFSTASDEELEIVYHTRILEGPHAQQDALGVSALIGDQRILIHPSSQMSAGIHSRDWHRYFQGSSSHNTIVVDEVDQRPLSRRREGLLPAAFDSYKVNRAVKRMGLEDFFTSFRRKFNLARLPLRERAVTTGGEILSYGSSGNLNFVTARHLTYEGIIHTRTVVRISPHLLIVWDRLQGKKEHTYTQAFHFAPETEVQLQLDQGTVEKEKETIARFLQIGWEDEKKACRGQLLPARCGWYASGPGRPHTTPVVQYTMRGKEAEFLWVMLAGSEKFSAQLQEDSLSENKGKLLLLHTVRQNYRIRLQGSLIMIEAEKHV